MPLSFDEIKATSQSDLLDLINFSGFPEPFYNSSIKETKRWSNQSLRFENSMAMSLLKYCYWLEDTEGRNMTLHFTKQKNLGEIDFVVCEDNKPVMFVEVKLADQDLNSRLNYFKKKYNDAQFFQIHLKGKKNYITPEGITVTSALSFLKNQIKTS
jgi:predicted AAA+ superfamily ATPase